MGTFHTTIEVAATHDGPFEQIEALVDSGATFTVLPAPRLERAGIQPTDRESFVLADGRVIEREISEVWVRLGGRVRNSMVVFGPDEAPPLLGAFALEQFALLIDPGRRELVRVPGYLVGLQGDGPS